MDNNTVSQAENNEPGEPGELAASIADLRNLRNEIAHVLVSALNLELAARNAYDHLRDALRRIEAA